MKNRLLKLLAMSVIILVTGNFPGFSDVSIQDKEDLLFEEIPIVITASRKEQPITQTASVVTVIDADDILYSGVTTIPDVLRMVAGLDVVSITPRHQQVSVRGFSGPSNNKLLVLIDGRTVFSDNYGMVFWDAFPVGLEEIERIEIVKSPSSSIYGANAFTGVINIITKTPEQLNGTRLRLTLGDESTLIGTILHAGKTGNGNLEYKLSIELDRTREWQTRQDDRATVTRFNGLVNLRFNPKTELALSLGRGHSRNRRFYQLGDDLGDVDDINDYLQADLKISDFSVRFFIKRNKTEREESTGIESWPTWTFNGDIFHSFRPLRRHNVIWGLNFRFNRVENNPTIDGNHHQSLCAIFLEDEITLSKKFRLTVGGRFDTHPLAGNHFSPRCGLSYHPFRHHVLRLSFARAFRNPTFNDSYMLQTWTRSGVFPFTFTATGNTELEPERITSYEIGYRGTISRHFRFVVDLYYTNYSNFFGVNNDMTFYEAGELFPGSPGGIPKAMHHYPVNAQSATGIGGEVHCDVTISEDVSGFINYSYQEITDKHDDSATPDVDESDRPRPYYPRHKVNAGLRVFPAKGFSINLTGHWIDKTRQLILEGRSHQEAKAQPYFLLNARIGYRFLNKNAELALAVQNIFDERHNEFPTNPEANDAAPPNHLGRRISLTMRYKF